MWLIRADSLLCEIGNPLIKLVTDSSKTQLDLCGDLRITTLMHRNEVKLLLVCKGYLLPAIGIVRCKYRWSNTNYYQ
jgi:hypothetical protein